MPLPPPTDPSLLPYLRVQPDSAELRNPTKDFVIQGLAILIVLPILFLLMAALVAAQEPRAALPVFAGAVALSLGSGLLAIATTAFGIFRARRNFSRIYTDGAIVLADGRRILPSEVRKIKAGKPGTLMKWKGVGLETHAGETIWVIRRLPPSKRKVIEGLSHWLGTALGAPVDSTDAGNVLGMANHHTAAACYMPIQGIWLIASILVLIFNRDPVTRFAARQSLIYYLASGIALAVYIVALALPVVLIYDRRGAPGIVAGVLVVLIVIPAVLRIVIGCVAMAKAWKGRTWVIPGLGWLVRRWLPIEPRP